MQPPQCRNCGYTLETGCTHLHCAQAHAQGFCGPSCKEAYYAIKEYELNRMEKSNDQSLSA